MAAQHRFDAFGAFAILLYGNSHIRSFGQYYLVLIVYYQVLNVYHLVLTAYYLVLTVYYLVLTVYYLV